MDMRSTRLLLHRGLQPTGHQSMLDELTARLREAQMALLAAVDLVDAAPETLFADPGKGYLLGKLELVLAVVEDELPEFRGAAEKQMARRLFEQLIEETDER